MARLTPISLPGYFPNTVTDPFFETSDPTEVYNCIAWACEDATKWYWPHPKRYWPGNIPREETLRAFQLLFEDRGYAVCENNLLEHGFLKVAIYCNANNEPTHASRQLPDGNWTSKLGDEWDVSHTMQNMDNGVYGSVAIIMKRKNE